jgi:hypothetical protein
MRRALVDIVLNWKMNRDLPSLKGGPDIPYPQRTLKSLVNNPDLV